MFPNRKFQKVQIFDDMLATIRMGGGKVVDNPDGTVSISFPENNSQANAYTPNQVQQETHSTDKVTSGNSGCTVQSDVANSRDCTIDGDQDKG